MKISSLFQLELARLRNEVKRFREDPKLLRRPVMLAVGIALYLYWFFFRNFANKPEKVIAQWHWFRYGFPVVLGWLATFVGGWPRMNRWLLRWSTGSWSVLPVEPKLIASWLTGSMIAVNSLWLGVGLAASLGFTFLIGIPWLSEFPMLLFATAILVTAGAVANTFSALILRLTGRRMLQWPNTVLKILNGLLAMALVQPLVGFWIFAEYWRQHEGLGFTWGILLIQMAVIAGLIWLARTLLVREWPSIAASYELQQTQRFEKSDLPLADLIVRPLRSPISKLVSLYNLRSGVTFNRWGGQVDVGGRRLYFFLFMIGMILFLNIMVLLLAIHDKDTQMVVLFPAMWVSFLVVGLLPPVAPAMRLLRLMPVTFGQWLWALAALPATTGFLFAIGFNLALAWLLPDTAVQTTLIMFGIFFGVVPLRVLIVSSFPGAIQAGELTFMAIVAVGGLLVYFVSWMAVVPWILAADYYFYRKAAQKWRWHEEGLHG